MIAFLYVKYSLLAVPWSLLAIPMGVCGLLMEARGGGHIRMLYKAPEDYTKPQNNIQSPDRLYKDPTDYTKPTKNIQSPKKAIQGFGMLDKDLRYSTRVATHLDLTPFNKQYQTFSTEKHRYELQRYQ